MSNLLDLDAAERQRIGSIVVSYIEAAISARSGCEIWWADIDRFYRNEPPATSPDDPIELFHVPYLQPRVDALTANVCTVVGKQEPYMVVTDGMETDEQQRKAEQAGHSVWKAAGFEMQLRKAASMAGRYNKFIFRLCPKEADKYTAPFSGAQLSDSRAPIGVELGVIKPQDFVIYPAMASGIEGALLVGHRFYRTPQEIRDMQDAGIYYETDGEIGGGGAPGSDDMSQPNVRAGANPQISADTETQPSECYSLVCTLRLKKEDDGTYGDPKRYYVTFNMVSKQVLAVEDHPWSSPEYFAGGYIAEETLFWGPVSVGRNLASAQDWYNRVNSALYQCSILTAMPLAMGPELETGEKYTKYKPGEYLVADQAAIPLQQLRLTFQGQPLTYQIQMLEALGDRIARVSQNTMGSPSVSNDTATEAGIVAAGVAVGLEEYIANFTAPLARMMSVTMEMINRHVMIPDPAMQDAVAHADSHYVQWEANGQSAEHNPRAKVMASQQLIEMSQDPGFGLDKYEVAKLILENGPLAKAANQLQVPKAALQPPPPPMNGPTPPGTGPDALQGVNDALAPAAALPGLPSASGAFAG